MEDNYIPYGDEWEKEMMKLPKKYLIDMFKKAQIRLHLAEKLIEIMPCEHDVTRQQREAYAEWMESRL